MQRIFVTRTMLSTLGAGFASVAMATEPIQKTGLSIRNDITPTLMMAGGALVLVGLSLGVFQVIDSLGHFRAKSRLERGHLSERIEHLMEVLPEEINKAMDSIPEKIEQISKTELSYGSKSMRECKEMITDVQKSIAEANYHLNKARQVWPEKLKEMRIVFASLGESWSIMQKVEKLFSTINGVMNEEVEAHAKISESLRRLEGSLCGFEVFLGALAEKENPIPGFPNHAHPVFDEYREVFDEFSKKLDMFKDRVAEHQPLPALHEMKRKMKKLEANCNEKMEQSLTLIFLEQHKSSKVPSLNVLGSPTVPLRNPLKSS